MRENEFERKVQEQMQELRLRPSEEIWHKVEEELKRKKRRRVGFFIFLLAGLGLLGYSGYTLLQDSSKPVAQTTDTQNNSATVNNQTSTNTNTAVAQHDKTPTEQSSSEPAKTNTNEVHLKANDKNEIAGSDVAKNTEKQNHQQHNQTINRETSRSKLSGNDQKDQVVVALKKPRTQVQSIEAEKDRTVKPRTNKSPVEKKGVEKDIVAKNADDQNTKQIDEPIKDMTGKDAEAKKDIATVNNDPVKNIQTAQPLVDSVTMLVAQDSTIASASIKQSEELLKDSATQIVVNKKKSPSKIKFGVEFSGGISSSRKELIGLSTGKSMLADNLLSQAPGGATNVPQRIIIPPSSVKSGNGFRIGLVVEKKLSQRSSLSSGLRYTYMNEHIKVGSFKDTLVFSNSYQSLSYIGRGGVYSGAAYANGSVKIIDYTNKYHFLEIPIQYQLQLSKSKSKVPVIWNVGLTAGYLLSTNAVIYDTAAGGIYYQSKDAFKRFHTSFQTGFSFLFGGKKKIQWSLGPDISLDMTRLMKEDVFTRKRYLLYTGLTGKIFFNSKK